MDMGKTGKTMSETQQSSTKHEILEQLLKQGQATAHDLAEHLDISPQAVRRHLKDLEAEALIEHHAIQEGMGRPNHLYQLSRKGRDRFPAQYDEFAISLLDTLTETVGREQVGSILQKQWKRKAKEYRERLGSQPLADRVATLVELRRAEGYMAEWYRASSVDDQTEPRFVITEYNCAISQIAESFPLVCDHELQMFQEALEGCSVERTHWLVNGEHRCGYLIKVEE
jgi:DeoR family suf operon transcriptional repressor